MDYWEQQYNPRIAVPDAQRHFDIWRARAAEARSALAGQLDAAYGPHERERLDVFRADSARAALVFLHGGYWRAFGKEDFSWVAAPFVKAGITVVIPSYPLCPAVALRSIGDSVMRAMDHIATRVLTPDERERVVLVGHSAGAHLAAQYFARSAAHESSALEPAAVVCISGLFDLLPLLHVPFLKSMDWSAAELHEVSPLYQTPPGRGELILAVGEAESLEFHRQSERLGDAWAARCGGALRVAGRNHFNVIDTLYEPGGFLARLILERF